MPQDYVLVDLRDTHSFLGFDCGHEGGNYNAKAAVENNGTATKTIVATHVDDPVNVCGYITFTLCSPSNTDLPVGMNKAKFGALTPCMFISFVAVDLKHQRKKLGQELVLEVYTRAGQVNKIAPCSYVFLELANEELYDFYHGKLGMEYKNKYSRTKMFIQTDTISAFLEERAKSED